MLFGAPWSRPIISLTLHSVRGVLRKATQGGQVGGESPAGVALPHCDRNRLDRPGVGGSPARPVRAQTSRCLARGQTSPSAVHGPRTARGPRRGGRARERADRRLDRAGGGRTRTARAGVAGRHLLALPALRGPGRGEPPCDAGAAHPVRLPPRFLPSGRARAAGVVPLRPPARPAAAGDPRPHPGDRRGAALPPGQPARHRSGRQLGAVDQGRARTGRAVRQVRGRVAHPGGDGRVGRRRLARLRARGACDAGARLGRGVPEHARRRAAQHLVPRPPVRRSHRGRRGADVGQ